MEFHLSNNQIEELLQLPPHAAGETDSHHGDLEGVKKHLETCERCRSKLRAHRRTMERLASLNSRMPAGTSSTCPSDEVWLQLAAGIGDGGSVELLNHAAECDHCGPLLRQALADLAEEVSPDEETIIAGLSSSKATWQHELAAKIARRTPKLHFRFRATTIRVIGFSALAASLVIIAVISAGPVWWGPNPERLLAQAYTEHRTLDLRIPGADASPSKVERGANGSLMTQSPTLLQAEALISRKLRQHPDDPYWLQMKARADLLNWNYGPAITSLTEAQSVGGDNPTLLIDLASAFFERAETTQQPADYGKAIELLGGVLDKDPNNETALFNRALVLYQLSLYSQSLNDWKKYLSLYPNGRWASEAKDHEKEVQGRQHSRHTSDDVPLLEPESFVHLAAQDATFSQQIDPRIEDYFDIALRDWIPIAFSPVGRSISPSARRTLSGAVMLLSRRTFQEHQDGFFHDLLADSANPALFPAIKALSDAINNNRIGKHGEAVIAARLGEKEFRRIGNEAGQLRAEFEQAYGAQRTFHAEDCIDTATRIAVQSRIRRYKWLEAQSLIEEAFCNNMEGRVGRAAVESQRASQVARGARYHDTFLRASVGDAATEWEAGSIPQAWTLILQGLKDYWDGHGSTARGMAFYAVMDAIAEYDLQGHLQSAVIKEYLPLINEDSDPEEAVMAWYRLGDSELQIHHDAESMQAFQRAEFHLAAAPHSVAPEDWEVLGIVGLAKVELERGKFGRSYELLDSVRSSIPRVQESFAVMDFYEALGEVAERSGKKRDAARAYETAITISERALSTIKDAQDRLTWSRTFTPAYRGLVNLKLESGDPTGALALWEWYHAIALRPRYSKIRAKKVVYSRVNIRAPFDESGINELSNAIAEKSHSNVIIYAQLNNRIAVWTLGQRGLSAKWLDVDPTKLDRVIEQFATECSDPSSDKSLIRLHGRLLYSWLIQPVEGLLTQGVPITIEPDQSIARIPMEALTDSSGQYFGNSHTVVLSPGIAYYTLAHDGPFFGKDSHIVVAQSDTADPAHGLFPDQASAEEARDIAEMFPRSKLLTRETLDDSGLRNALAGAEIFHYSGHAETDAAHKGLVLRDTNTPTDASVLQAGDIYSMPLRHCRLAVLAGCSTGLGTLDRWANRDSIVLPFLNAGVRCVVASRWQVDSSTTHSLMRSFYTGLLSGSSVAQALQVAKVQIRSDRNTEHPYYWASFDIYGPCESKS